MAAKSVAYMPKPAEPTGYVSTAILSLKPLEVILVADSHIYAKWLAQHVEGGRLDRTVKDSKWVWVRLPRDLKLVRKASDGTIAFEFDNKDSATAFGKSLGGKGNTTKVEGNVYVGAIDKQKSKGKP
jgi:hypothetical protein